MTGKYEGLYFLTLARVVGVIATFLAGWYAYECQWVLVGILLPTGAAALWYGVNGSWKA